MVNAEKEEIRRLVSFPSKFLFISHWIVLMLSLLLLDLLL